MAQAVASQPTDNSNSIPTRMIVDINIENKDLILRTKTQDNKETIIKDENESNNRFSSWYESPHTDDMGICHASIESLCSIFENIDYLKGLHFNFDLIRIIHTYCNNKIVALSFAKNLLPTETTESIFKYFYKLPCNYRLKDGFGFNYRSRRTTSAKVNDIIDPYLFVYDLKTHFEFIPTLVEVSLNTDTDAKSSHNTANRYKTEIINTPLTLYYDPKKDKRYTLMYDYFEMILGGMIPLFEDILGVSSFLDLKQKNNHFQFIFKVIQYEMYQSRDYYANLWHLDGIESEHIKCIGIFYSYNSFDSGNLEFTFDKNINPRMHTIGQRRDKAASSSYWGMFGNNKKDKETETKKNEQTRLDENKQYKASYFGIKSQTGTAAVWNNEDIQHRMGFWKYQHTYDSSGNTPKEADLLAKIGKQDKSDSSNSNGSNDSNSTSIEGARQAIIVMMIDPKYELKNYDKNDQRLNKITFEKAKQRVSKVRQMRRGYVADKLEKNGKNVGLTANAKVHKLQNVTETRNDAELEFVRSMPWCADCGAAGHCGTGPTSSPP